MAHRTNTRNTPKTDVAAKAKVDQFVDLIMSVATQVPLANVSPAALKKITCMRPVEPAP
jgi:hypothetical protein